jgi:hypothetical protein
MLPVPPRPEDEAAAPEEAEAPAQEDAGPEHVLLEARSAAGLQALVNDYLQQGWRLQGGVAVATTGALDWWYYQAVAWPSRGGRG